MLGVCGEQQWSQKAGTEEGTWAIHSPRDNRLVGGQELAIGALEGFEQRQKRSDPGEESTRAEAEKAAGRLLQRSSERHGWGVGSEGTTKY